MSSLNLLFVAGEAIGYGRLGVKLAASLERMGMDLYADLPNPQGEAHIRAHGKSGICSDVCWISVPTHARGWYHNQTPHIFSMWEATFLPESFRETMHEFATVIVPSQQNVDLFSQYHPNVRYVPLGVDPAEWHYVERTPPGRFFDYLIGGSGPRKGVDLAVKAFKRVFKNYEPGAGPVPRLILKNPKGEDYYGQNIEMVAGRISPEEEQALYARAHVYLQPSRGEGFGLQPLQAIAQGMPTILTDAHGHAGFAHLAQPIGSTLVDAAYFIYGDAGQWWEPDFGELCERMWWTFQNYDEACAEAEISAKVVAEEWTWGHTARAFLDALGDAPLTMLDEPGEWHTPQEKRYLVIFNRDWNADIAGVSYAWKKGESYYELADVKRIAFEAGLLDVACLQTYGERGDTMDLGLTPEQYERIPAYTGAHSYCECCGQKLGTGITRAQELMGET